MKKKIGIIGCGNMGEVIVRNINPDFGYDISKQRLRYIVKRYQICPAHNNIDLVKNCDVIIIAVKPQDIKGVLVEISSRPDLLRKRLIVSIAAGVPTEFIEKNLNTQVRVVRVMPNLPSFVSSGISAISKGRYAGVGDLEIVERMFRRIGEVVRVKQRDMDAVTAISGSGPAYFFFLVEILKEAGLKLGLCKKVAYKLSLETAFGSAKMLKELQASAEELRRRVTSKGGTTEAAFKVFMKKGLDKVLTDGIFSAAQRSKELRCLL